MCYNCGCRMPNDDMGDERNITQETFQEAAVASNDGKVLQAMQETHDLLGKEIEKLKAKQAA